MTETGSLGLSLFDFVPNLAFLLGAVFLVLTARLARGRRCAWLIAGGTLLIFLGGMLKATWKLLYTTGVGDVQVMSEAQFALLAPGFLLMLAGTTMLVRRQAKEAAFSSQPPVLAMALWKIPLLLVMTVCSIAAYGLLTYAAFRRGLRLAGALFIIAAFCLLAMSGMAGGEQTVARQWMEQSTNATGQSAFALGSLILYRSWRRVASEVGYV
jgi:hypothetical protein